MSDGFVEKAKGLARKAYAATIGNPLASGKGRHEYAAKQGFAGSADALRSGTYSPASAARDIAKAASNPQYNVRNAGLRRRSSSTGPATEY